MGPLNVDKESVPCLAAHFRDSTTSAVLKAKAKPMEGDKGYGLHLLAMLDATMVEGYGQGGPMVDPKDFRNATRKLCSGGLWPNNSNPSNLLNKLAKYKGGMSTYTGDNAKKTSWYAMAELEAPTSSGDQSFFFQTH